jgi:hypothetical protein
MKRFTTKWLLITLMIWPAALSAQIKSFEQVKQQALDSLPSPNLLNEAEASYMAALQKKDTSAYNFMRDLNLKFKTFQANPLPPGLGFSYQYDNSWTKNSISTAHDFSQSFNLDLDGNVAFKKADNPVNFLESKFVYNSTFFWGGLAKKNTKAQADQLRKIKLDLDDAITAGDAAKIKLLQTQAVALTHITDQYYIGINGSASYESNQDFSKTQFVPSLLINAGASSFNDGSTLSWFNLPDYPFALLRYLTNTDEHFSVSGVAIPSILFGVDYVVPTADTLRQSITGALNPYTRIRFEASFKTEAARAGGQVFWFSADYRWYHELNASQALINAHIDHFNYFTCALSASNGFFVSYSAGQLPFDQKNTSVYSLGFNYNLGNWK